MSTFWPLGIRGKTVRLLNDAGFDVTTPLASELTTMLVMSAKRLRSQAGGKVDEWACVLAAATILPDNDTALPHLTKTTGVSYETAFQAMTKISYQALIKQAELKEG